MSESTPSGIRIRRLQLFTPPGADRTYEVDFTLDGKWRPLSIIAGASQTGKTSTIEYIIYCLGGSSFPEHEEMAHRVAAVALEIEIDGIIHTIERTAAGTPSKFASIWSTSLDKRSSATETRLTIDPPSDPDSLSQFLLAAFGMRGIRLPLSPSRADSETQALSIRDVSRIFYFRNSRLDSQNLLEERGNPVVAQKLQQTIDLVFNVADASLTQLKDRIRAAEQAKRQAERSTEMLKAIVDSEYPSGPAGVETQESDALKLAAKIRAHIESLDSNELNRQGATEDLRRSLTKAEAEVKAWDVRVRGRESLIDRLRSLALQYADDKKKLIFLKEAERLFNPLHVTHCPACFAELAPHPHITSSGRCSLCNHETNIEGDDEHSRGDGKQLIERELAATTRRLDQLNIYLDSLTRELDKFYSSREHASALAKSVAAELDRVASLPAPFLALRDQLTKQLAEVEKDAAHQTQGIRLWDRVRQSQNEVALRVGQLAQLRKEHREQAKRPDRDSVVRAISDRFVRILGEFGYPKLDNAWLDAKLKPTVRGVNYTKASSGGLTLISLAWALALWETAYERKALAPGILIIDSPQKNLGHSARPDDNDFADAKLVNNVYEHVKRWLATAGAGAQIIFVDNSPPLSVEDHVIVRFSGRATQPPFGLIDDAIS
ncbi:hypothetical protein [Actinomyces naeslundii]|uniref:hypothetical protein n=1 Tax=Actinomyces naeslundii TaxID=1655 RepID=UPI0011789075|nr:hypothetical protein [Actinomyces naeslundii]